MKWLKAAVLSMVAATVCASGAFAAGANENAAIALHLIPRVAKNICADVEATAPTVCNDFFTESDSLGDFSAVVLVANYHDSLGVAGTQFGIDFTDSTGVGVDVTGWTRCADLEFPENGWPFSAPSGNTITWESSNNCQTGVEPIVVGVFSLTVYSPDLLAIVPRPVDGKAKVADCPGAENDITGLTPSRLGFIAFQSGEGYNPCAVTVPVEPTTWGGIKGLYRN